MATLWSRCSHIRAIKIFSIAKTNGQNVNKNRKLHKSPSQYFASPFIFIRSKDKLALMFIAINQKSKKFYICNADILVMIDASLIKNLRTFSITLATFDFETATNLEQNFINLWYTLIRNDLNLIVKIVAMGNMIGARFATQSSETFQMTISFQKMKGTVLGLVFFAIPQFSSFA